MRIFAWVCGIIMTATLVAAMPAAAVFIGQIDTFEDGTDQNWKINLLGYANPLIVIEPSNVSTGGPTGADDNFLMLTATGNPNGGGRLTAINFQAQWAGDYLAAGIGAIIMDVNNFGTTDLALRLLLAETTSGPPINLAFSSTAVPVPAGGGWMTISFSLNPADLTAGIGSVQNALANATELRIYHSVSANFPNSVTSIPLVTANLGVDNILAAAAPPAPVPGSLFLLGSGCLVLTAWRKKQQ